MREFLFIDHLSIFGRGQTSQTSLYSIRKEVIIMKCVSCFELYPSILDANRVQNLILELFPYMHTALNEDGGLDMYITREEYLFVLNELSKLNNYALSMPDAVKDINVTLTAMPIEMAIVERYVVLYDLMFEVEYISREVEENTLISDRENGSKFADYFLGKKLSQYFDVDEKYQQYLMNISKDI